MISTKGRYSLRVMIDLAEHSGEQYIPLRDVAKRQGLSLKYLERILPTLSKHHLVEAVHGKGGGYRLVRPPEDYTAWEILLLAEGNMSPVACLEENAETCPRAENCSTLELWTEYYQITKKFFEGKTLADLARKGKQI